MKTHSSSLHRRGFTLIELLVVIAIIAILSALSMGGYTYIARKQADSQATIQISLLEKAIEEYKLDNGSYPPTDDSSQGYDPGPKSIKVYDVNGDPSSLLGILYQYGADNKTTIYLSTLDPVNNRQGWTTTATGNDILDPWGIPYRYRTALGKPVKNPDGSVTVPTNSSTKNPDFDIWSSGKDTVSGTPDDIDNY